VRSHWDLSLTQIHVLARSPIANPDPASELRVLVQLAPELDVAMLKSLVAAFQDLRKEFDAGALSYPFSLRELLALVRHLRRYPSEPLEQALRNIFDFDASSRPETLDALMTVLRRHKLGVRFVGMDAVRGQELPEGELRKAGEISFDPEKEGRDTDLGGPKYGKTDNEEHHGGNTWAGGTGGRDTAGLGGRVRSPSSSLSLRLVAFSCSAAQTDDLICSQGGYMRLYKGHDIRQVPDGLKAQVPDEIQNRARDMARKELAEKLAEIDMTSAQASSYTLYHERVRAHVHQLVTFLESASRLPHSSLSPFPLYVRPHTCSRRLTMAAPSLQTSRPRRRSASGSSARSTASSTSRGSPRASRARRPSTSGEGRRSPNSERRSSSPSASASSSTSRRACTVTRPTAVSLALSRPVRPLSLLYPCSRSRRAEPSRAVEPQSPSRTTRPSQSEPEADLAPSPALAVVMICEAFNQLSKQGKSKYSIDILGHSGEGAEIPFVAVDALPSNAGDRWRIVEKMALISQCVLLFSLSLMR